MDQPLNLGSIIEAGPSSFSVCVPGHKFHDCLYPMATIPAHRVATNFETAVRVAFPRSSQETVAPFGLTRLLQENPNRTVSLSSLTIQMEKIYYDTSIDVDQYEVKNTLIATSDGKSQIIVAQALQNRSNGAELGFAHLMFDYLNKDDGRLCGVPEWFKQCCLDDNIMRGFTGESNGLVSGSDFSYLDKVLHFDLDPVSFYGIRLSAYIRYCVNAGLLASKKRSLFHFYDCATELTPFRLKTIHCTVLGPSERLDTIQAKVWNTSRYEESFSQRFILTNEQTGNHVFKAEIYYHEPGSTPCFYNDFYSHKVSLGQLQPVVASDDHTIFECTGLCGTCNGLNDFNLRTGNALLWISADIMSFHAFNFMASNHRIKEFFEKFIAFYVTHNFEFSEEYYVLARSGELSNSRARSRILNVGRSSVDLTTAVVVGKKTVATYTGRSVFVDKYTRKTSVEVQRNVSKCFGNIKASSLPEYLKNFELPDNYTNLDYVVRPCDIDDNVHTNHTVYMLACIEGAVDACAKGLYKNFSGDFERYPVRKARVLFSDESGLGDVLTVYSWEPAKTDDELCFIICKNNHPIFYAKMTFFLDAQFYAKSINDSKL